jgi:hypothetical protein
MFEPMMIAGSDPQTSTSVFRPVHVSGFRPMRLSKPAFHNENVMRAARKSRLNADLHDSDLQPPARACG